MKRHTTHYGRIDAEIQQARHDARMVELHPDTAEWLLRCAEAVARIHSHEKALEARGIGFDRAVLEMAALKPRGG